MARPDDDPNIVIGKPDVQHGLLARPHQFASSAGSAGSGSRQQQPSSVLVGQSIKFALGDESGPPPQPPQQQQQQRRPVNPSPVSVVSGQQTVFFEGPLSSSSAAANNNGQNKNKPADDGRDPTDRFVDEDEDQLAGGGNLLGSANTQQPATVPAPVLPAELPPAPKRPAVNPLFGKDRPPPAVQLPRIVPQQPGQALFQSNQVPNIILTRSVWIAADMPS